MSPYETAQLVDVEHNFAFQPHRRIVDDKPTPLLTFCNCAASVFCAARGIHLPPELANKQLLFLLERPAEWERVTRDRALELVNTDPTETVLAVAEYAEHGHIGACVESPPEDRKSLYVTSAGARNFNRTRLESSFGFLKPVFFRHRKGATP